uniref:Uncharacterized protein n=1 Tax=Arundo donax TaxID=35708 RepID=A0A0A8Z794_ARUDO
MVGHFLAHLMSAGSCRVASLAWFQPKLLTHNEIHPSLDKNKNHTETIWTGSPNQYTPRSSLCKK